MMPALRRARAFPSTDWRLVFASRPRGATRTRESIAELKKVEWPTQPQLVQGVAVVIIACVIVGTYLWLNDQLWKYVVQHVLLR